MISFGIAFQKIHLGFDSHIWMASPGNVPKMVKLYYIYFHYDISIFLANASTLLFLTRLFPEHSNSKWWKYTLWATYGLNVAWLIGIILGTVFACDRYRKDWDSLLSQHCGADSALWAARTVSNILIDLIILASPVPKILVLRVSRSQKAGAILVFLLGNW